MRKTYQKPKLQEEKIKLNEITYACATDMPCSLANYGGVVTP